MRRRANPVDGRFGKRYLDSYLRRGMLLSATSQGRKSERTLAEVAARIGVDVDLLRKAFTTDAKGRAELLLRASRVTKSLEEQLGGRDALHVWAETPLPALGQRRPVDVLSEGRITPLERLDRVLKAGVFS